MFHVERVGLAGQLVPRTSRSVFHVERVAILQRATLRAHREDLAGAAGGRRRRSEQGALLRNPDPAWVPLGALPRLPHHDEAPSLLDDGLRCAQSQQGKLLRRPSSQARGFTRPRFLRGRAGWRRSCATSAGQSAVTCRRLRHDQQPSNAEQRSGALCNNSRWPKGSSSNNVNRSS